MGRAPMGGVPDYLRGLLGGAEQRSDRDLLNAFAARHDEAAFAAIIQRHGPLVWGVCRRLLRDEQDAEDAFQATFLVLARKASSIPWREDAGNWLYAVALRVAHKARARGHRQRRLEREAGMASREAPVDGPDGETAAVVAEEVGRLPEKYRRPVVLCCLEGKSYSEAAQLLGWPEGTVAGRLARAREMLRRRLVRRGMGPVEASPTALPLFGAPPAVLVQATLGAASRFAAGEKLPGPAAALAEEVLRAMLLTKLKSAAALLLALVILGSGLTLLARAVAPATPPSTRTAPPADRPAGGQPAEWAGRWLANPFAGAVTIEVEHARRGGGPPQVYRIKEPAAVAAVARAARITEVRNDVYAGCIPSARLTVRDQKGVSFEAGLGSDGCLFTKYGLMGLDERFFAALGQAAAGQGKPAIDFRKFLPEAVPAGAGKPATAFTARSLASGFACLDVNYVVAGQPRTTRIADARTLTTLHRALLVVATAPAGTAQARGRYLSGTCKDGASFYLHILDGKTVFDFKAGKFTLAPAFFEAVNREVSRRAGFPIDVARADNRLPEQSVVRARRFRELLDSVRSLRCLLKRGSKTETILLEGEEARGMVKQLAWAEGQPHELKLPRGDISIQLTTKDGRTIDLRWLGQAGTSGQEACARPVLGQLVEVSGLGQVWIDSQWQGRFHDLAYKREREEKQRRDLETSRLVCRRWATFLDVVLSVSASYGQDGSELSGALSRDGTRAALALLRNGQFERLDWSEKRWRKVLDGVASRAGSLELAPGLGFSLPLLIVGDKEMLVPMCGRLRFADSPIAALQRIIDPDKPARVRLLPDSKGKE